MLKEFLGYISVTRKNFRRRTKKSSFHLDFVAFLKKRFGVALSGGRKLGEFGKS
jgi:hypothetical protein